MSILDKFSNMFGSKDTAPAEPIVPASPAGGPAMPIEPTEPAVPAEAPDISPQPDMITPGGEAPAEEAPEEKNEGEDRINLNV